MSKARWAWAGVAALVVPAALGAGLWLGGGPTTREGWEAAAWAAGITATLYLVASVVVWAAAPTSSPTGSAPVGQDPPAREGQRADVANTVHGDIHGGTVVQGGTVHLGQPSYGGDHIDFRDSTFHGPVIGKQSNTPAPGEGQGPAPER